MQVVDSVAGALFDLLELQLIPHANAGDEVIQTANDNKPVITTGMEALQWLQNELALDRIIADLGRNIRHNQVNRLIRRMFEADTADCGDICHVVERRIPLSIAHRQEIAVKRSHPRRRE